MDNLRILYNTDLISTIRWVLHQGIQADGAGKLFHITTRLKGG